MNRSFLVCFLIAIPFCCNCVIAQPNQEFPEVGNPMPEFTLPGVKYHKHHTVTDQMFKGKWLFLYFWSLGCKGSVQGLAKIDSIQKEFPDELQVIAIGHNKGEINSGIETVYDRIRKTRHLTIPVAYDSVLRAQWDIETVPHIYVIDPRRILRYVIDGSDMTVPKVRNLLNGESVFFLPKDEGTSWKSDGLFNQETKMDELRYASVLTKWNGEKPNFGFEFDRWVEFPETYLAEGWTMTKAPLERLYAYAYFGRAYWFPVDTAFYGKIYQKPILEIDNHAPFELEYNCFLKLAVDAVTIKNLKYVLQDMLRFSFDYEPTIEVREMPVWKVLAEPWAEEKLRSHVGPKAYFGGNPIVGFTVKSYAIRDFLRLVTSNLPNPDNLAFIDQTGIDYRIDIKIETDMTDLKSVVKALNRYGLNLVKSTKRMKVLVIREGRVGAPTPH